MSWSSKHPHLGQVIEGRLKERGMSKAELGRRINTSRQNVSLILNKHSLDTALLNRIGEVLDFDFFAFLSQSSENRLPDQGHVQITMDFSNQRLVLVTAENSIGLPEPLQFPD